MRKIYNKSLNIYSRCLLTVLVGCYMSFVYSSSYSKLYQQQQPLVIPSKVKDYFNKYFSNNELVTEMHLIADTCPKVSRLFSIGNSTKGYPIYALQFGEDVSKQNGRPNFRIVANIHADETSFRQVLLAFSRYLCMSIFETDGNKVPLEFLSKVNLYIIPTLNPDQFPKDRENSNGVDLNRNFPDMLWDGFSTYRKNEILSASRHSVEGLQQETKVLMDFAKSINFVGSISIHEGDMVANYPNDGSQLGKMEYSKSEDDETFQYLSRSYSYAHREMHKSHNFKDGITNGADWYPIYGSMQDWCYYQANQMELTLEVSENKNPEANELGKVFEDNIYALLSYPLVASYSGIHGYIGTYQCSKAHNKNCIEESIPTKAKIRITGSKLMVTSNAKFGSYYRSLAPGKYQVQVSKMGYLSIIEDIIILEDQNMGLEKNFTLKKGLNIVSTNAIYQFPRLTKAQSIYIAIVIVVICVSPAALIIYFIVKNNEKKGSSSPKNGYKLADKI